MNLSAEQKESFELYEQGKNIFITGPGGSGKSELLKIIYDDCIDKEKKVAVTALTGIAANLLGCKATTLHSWAGIGLGTQNYNLLLKKIKRSKSKLEKWKETDILIIDEVSMLSLFLLELLEHLSRDLRGPKLFGGIQLIFSGDFFQLPPISPAAFCFESKIFDSLFPNKVMLTSIYRQSDDIFKKLLCDIRVGKITKSSLKLLNSRIGLDIPNEIVPTVLSPVKKYVEEINTKKLNELPGESHVYTRNKFNNFELTSSEKKRLLLLTNAEVEQELTFIYNNNLSEEKLSLKKGAHVMCIVNTEEFVNGTQGIVEDFVNGFPVVKFYSGHTKLIMPYLWKSEIVPGVGLEQIPLILSWAITIHKSQGCSLDYAMVNIGQDIFEAGQTYVALSRLKSLDGLYISFFSPEKIRVNTKVIEFYKNNFS